jgi:hypothetical protein
MYDEESTLTYIKINIVVSIVLILITIMEADSSCGAPIHVWLMVYVVFSGIDSLMKVLMIKYGSMGRSNKIYLLEIAFEFV